MRSLLPRVALLLSLTASLAGLGATPVAAQALPSPTPSATSNGPAVETVSFLGGGLDAALGAALAVRPARDGAQTVGAPASELDPEEDGRLTTAVEIAVLLTVLSLLPALLVSVTSFTRIIIVLSFVRRSMSINELPPNPVVIGLALFLTAFVMGPVATRVYDEAWQPYKAGELTAEDAGSAAWGELSAFLLANTREGELELFRDLALDEVKAAELGVPLDAPVAEVAASLPMRVVVPAFVLSELKTAFQMGFLLFLPFLVIDIVVSSVLLSMGMFMLPPVMVSTPFKILLFVLVDGWHLICQSLVTSFITT